MGDFMEEENLEHIKIIEHVSDKSKADQVREEILSKIDEYYKAAFNQKFIPGKTYVQNSGKLFDSEELKLGVQAVLDGWWTEGRFAEMFAKELGEFLPAKYVALANSGSSANLVAFFSLTSPLLPKERRLMPGDEVITVAAGFPTTVNPIVQAGCVPVFVDVNIETLTVDVSKLEESVSEKTKAVFIAHPLGNPFNIDAVKKICDKHNLWFIEDSCDALGSKYKGQHVGTFGDIATISFYPAHHITMGEGGAIFTNNAILDKIVRSFRDWGRDCWCLTGRENTCGKRFSWKLGDLPFGYDHKFIYSHPGYNVKLTDMQAAIGLAQLRKLPQFIEARKRNFAELFEFFSQYTDYFYLPKSEQHAEPSWFGFPLTIKTDKFSRNEILTFLNEKKVGTRLIFAGNITRQPYFKSYGIKYRITGDLNNTDYIMNNTFWIGVQPNITAEMLDHVKASFKEFFNKL